MRKRLVALVVATLAGGMSYVYGPAAVAARLAPNPQRTAQFADEFARLQASSSNSAAFMQPAKAGASRGDNAMAADGMARPHDVMGRKTSGAAAGGTAKANGTSHTAPKDSMRHDAMARSGADPGKDTHDAMSRSSPMQEPIGK